jgi:peptidoglycan/LPS O-acetylase OafA/YrhL
MGLFRLALALSVLLGHSGGHGFLGLGFLDRQIAVQCFFIISGFYMALILNEKYVGPGRYGIFLQQRFLRLFPTYLILLTIILLIDGSISLARGKPYLSMEPWFTHAPVMTPGSLALLVYANVGVLGQDLIALLQFDPATGQLAFTHAVGSPPLSAHLFFLNRPSWSLGVEFAFYLIAPWLVCRPVAVQAAALIASWAFRSWISHAFGTPWSLFPDNPWAYTFFPPNLGFFLAGSIGYVFYRTYKVQLAAKLPSYQWTFYPFAVFVATYSRLPASNYLFLALIPIVCVMVPVLFAATRNNLRDRLIGELSYPFYLIHEHILFYLKSIFVAINPKNEGHLPFYYAPACVLITLGLAWLFYRFIETRTERYREKLFQRFRQIPSALDPDQWKATA